MLLHVLVMMRGQNGCAHSPEKALMIVRVSTISLAIHVWAAQLAVLTCRQQVVPGQQASVPFSLMKAIDQLS